MKNLKFILILAVMLLALGAPAQAASLPKEKRETLCGQLAFMTVRKTGQRLIGLIPCGRNQPIIFIARPGQLYNYYRFKNVTLSKGDKIVTNEYGTIDYFIEKFESFVEIPDCRGCQERAPTSTPIPRRAALGCGDYLLENGEKNYFPELGDAAWKETTVARWETFARGGELVQNCGEDLGCQTETMMLLIGESLGARLEYTPQRHDMLIAFLYEQLLKPETAAVCPDFAWTLRYLAAGLSRQGFSIDALAAASPATLRVTDRLGRQAGLLANGATVEEIPGSKVAVTGQNKLVLLPGGLFVELVSAETVITWTAAGAARIELAINRGEEVWLASFDKTQHVADGWAVLDLAGEPPWLKMVDPGGSVEAPSGSIAATSFKKLSVEANKAPAPSPWPTVTPPRPTETFISTDAPVRTPVPATPVAQAQPSATAAPIAAPTESAPAGAPSACPFSAGLAVLLVGILRLRRA